MRVQASIYVVYDAEQTLQQRQMDTVVARVMALIEGFARVPSESRHWSAETIPLSLVVQASRASRFFT